MQLRDRDEIEAAFAARLSRLNSEFRHRLQDLVGTPPDFNKVHESFWFEAEAEMKHDIAIAMLLVFTASAVQHGMPSNLVELSGLRYVNDKAPTVAREFIATSRVQFDTVRTKIIVPVEMKTAVPAPAPALPAPQIYTPAELEAELVKIFGPARAESVAVTETTAAQGAGGEAAIGATVGWSEADLWITRNDERVCPKCDPLHRQPRSVWNFYYENPPAHPRCRCWIQYANERVTA